MITSQEMPRLWAYSYCSVRLGAACGSISAATPASHRLRASAMRSLSRPPPPRLHTSTSAWDKRGNPATAYGKRATGEMEAPCCKIRMLRGVTFPSPRTSPAVRHRLLAWATCTSRSTLRVTPLA